MNARAQLGRALFVGGLIALAACGERRDIADVAAGLPPFDELRGTNIATLRGGQVRAMRANIQPSPLEGYRERIGDWDVVYTSQGFDGSDGSWPQEDVQILEVEATKQMPSDSVGKQTWLETAKQVRNVTGATPRCLMVQGSGFGLYVVEFDRGGDWRLALSYAPSVRLPNKKLLSSRVGIAVRRNTLTQRFPERGQPNPDSLPTWTPETEACRFP
jgi:hypothetical protein